MSHLIVLMNIFGISQAYFESCEQTINIAAGETKYLQSPGYSQGVGYVPGTSCRYTIRAPVDYQIKASCTMNMYDVSQFVDLLCNLFY